ncbi:MAG: DUF4265 domain-containing protein [Flavobacteriales bacterium]
MEHAGAIPSFLSEELCFNLDVDEDWPPVAVEEVPSEPVSGAYKVLMPPLFVKDLSVGDVISVVRDDKGYVDAWTHAFRSDRTTIWLLRLKSTPSIEGALTKLRALGCNIVSLQAAGSFSVDVPAEIPFAHVDAILNKLDGDEVGIAYPSLRHSV